jgi:hypothetical protein
VTVYHGTDLSRIPELINGFDATQVKFNPGGRKHPGLFVAPDVSTAGFFGDVVLEIQVRAKNLHGTSWGGATGREQGIDRSPSLGDKYPHSFRPFLSDTMTDAGEPQALLRGLVSPGQIKRVRYAPHGSSPRWYSRQEFLALSVQTNTINRGRQTIQDLRHDLSAPNYPLETFFNAWAKAYDTTPERLKNTTFSILKSSTERGLRWVKEHMEQAGFGPVAIKSFLQKLEASVTNDSGQ